MHRREIGAIAVIDQCLHLLAQGAALCRRLTAADYGARSADPLGAAVGPQLRHTIEAYRSFLAGWREGAVDYDRRARDPRLETDPRAAAAALDGIAEQLAALPAAIVSQPLLVRADVAAGEHPDDAWSRSSGGRELRALVSHTVHHYALVALLLRGRGVEPGVELGVAPSTLAYWRQRDRERGREGEPAGARVISVGEGGGAA